MNQYFALFQIKPRFAIDTATLEQTYRTLAAQFHPDKFAAASSFEQKQAMMMASTINEAYRTLKQPIDRAAYLLKSEHQIDADAPEHTSFPPEFLMQQMEWREALEEARAEGNEQSLDAISQEVANEQKNLLNDLQTAFEQQQYQEAAQLVRNGRFLNKMQYEIESARP